MRTCFINLLCNVKVNHEVLVLLIDPLIHSLSFLLSSHLQITILSLANRTEES